MHLKTANIKLYHKSYINFFDALSSKGLSIFMSYANICRLKGKISARFKTDPYIP